MLDRTELNLNLIHSLGIAIASVDDISIMFTRRCWKWPLDLQLCTPRHWNKQIVYLVP